MNLIEKYKPKELENIYGQEKAIYDLNKYLTNFKKGKAILLYGPYGSGKTSSVYVLAKKFNKEVLEINASDVRNKDAINSILGNATKQQSLFSFNKGKIILMDDIDGISGTKDRGGIVALIKLISESTFPILITCNNPFDQKFSSLRKKCNLVEFISIDYKYIFENLKLICKRENISYTEKDLNELSMKAGGDMRAALTDLQLLTSNGKLDGSDLFGERKRTENISQALLKIFKTKNAKIASEAFNEVDEDIDKRMLWMEENLPKEYKQEDLCKGLDCLSKADVFRGRIRRWQHWRFLIYANNLISSGIAIAKKEKYKKIIQYKPTSKILTMWIYKNKYLKRKTICDKIAEHCHTSSKRALKDIFPYIQYMIKIGKWDLVKEFKFSDEEINWMKKE